MRRLAALTVLLIAGCGGASAKDYRAALDRECASNAAFNRSLPQRQREQHLSSAQVRALSEAHARAGRERLHKLGHPGSLDDEVAALDTLLDQAPQNGRRVAPLVAYLQRARALYADIGARGCLRATDASIAQLRSLPTPTPAP